MLLPSHCQKPSFTATGSINQSNSTASVAASEMTAMVFKVKDGAEGVASSGLMIRCNKVCVLMPQQKIIMNQLMQIIIGT